MSHFDAALFRKALGVGIDRMWVSYGTVAEDSPDAHSVRFKDADDVAIPEGPLVTVNLHPSEIPVTCRVAGTQAGIGEADWAPMLQGDEVIVLIPEGDTHAGCIIVGRCSNEIDTFPLIVGGQDVTQNTFGFKRLRTPYIIETASSYLVRSATTGAQFGIDQTGQFILNDGDGSSFVFGADALALSSADGSTSIQILVGDQQIAMTAGNTTSFLLDAFASQFTSTGTLSLGTAGTISLQHAISLEQVVILFQAFMASILVSVPAGPLIPSVHFLPPLDQTIIFQQLSLALAMPVTPFVPLITAGLSLPTDPTGTIVGVGRAGLMI